MILVVHVKAGSKKPGIEKHADHWVVRVRERPFENRANEAVIEAVARGADVARSRVRIISGLTVKRKRLEILE